MLTVGQLASASGVPATTLRYYDDLGLLVAERLPNGHRRYRPEALERLHLVRRCQSLGLSLDEVAAVLRPGGGAERRELAGRKLADLDRLLAELVGVRAVLAHLAECTHLADEGEACGAAVRAAWAS
jgi:YD repeat-containing protein